MRPATSAREQTLLLCCLIGAVQMTWGAIVPALPLYLDRYGLALGTLGPILAAFAAGRAVANAPAGLALRWWPPRRYLWWVAAGLVLVTAPTGLVDEAGPIMLLRFVAGLFGGATVTVAYSVLVTAAPPDRRGSVVATAMVAMMSAAAAGAVLGGVVVETLGVAWTFVAAVVPLLGVLAWEAARPADRYWSAYAVASTGAEAPPAPGASRGADRPLVLALCGVSFATFFVRFAGEQGLVPVMAYDGAGLRPATLAAAMAVGTVVSLAAMPLVGRLVDRGARRSVLLAGGTAGAAAIAALCVLHRPVAFAAALVVYFAATTAVNVVPGVVAGETWGPRDSGAVVGLTRTVGDVGAAAGPLVIFWLVDVSSRQAACVVMGLLLLASVVHLAGQVRRDGVPERAPVPAS